MLGPLAAPGENPAPAGSSAQAGGLTSVSSWRVQIKGNPWFPRFHALCITHISGGVTRALALVPTLRVLRDPDL